MASLEEGIGFGELALLDKRGTRAATIQAESKCFFGVISKEDFKMQLNKIEMSHKNELLDFVTTIPYFNKLSKLALNKIVTSLNKQECIMNQVITHEIFKKTTGEGDKDKEIAEPPSPSLNEK